MSKADLSKKIMASAFAVAGLTMLGQDAKAQIVMPQSDNNDSDNLILDKKSKKISKSLKNIKLMGNSKYSEPADSHPELINSHPELVSGSVNLNDGKNSKILNRVQNDRIFANGITTGGAAPTPTLDDLQSKASTVMPTLSGKYDLATEEGENTRSIVINGTTYYYTPNEDSQDKLNMLDYLAGSSSVPDALIVDTSATTEHYLFKAGETYYTFDTTKLPVSSYTGTTYSDFAFKNNPSDVATFENGASGNYDVKVSFDNNSDHTKYYNININPTKASHVGSKLSNINWSTTDPYSDPDKWEDYYSAGSKVTVGESTITGAIRMKMSHNGSVPEPSSWNKYFTYTYTKPTGYTITRARLNDNVTTDAVNKKVFAGITDEYPYNGAAIYNTKDLSAINITADFIGNYTYPNGAGGAIYNESNAKIGSIVGNFIGNHSYFNGGAIANAGTIGSIIGDFVGNSTVFSSDGTAGGGAIGNAYSATISSITGDFIGNFAYSATSSYGGAISNEGTISSITGDFIGNSAFSSSSTSYGGAIGNAYSATISSITGDFIGNSASSSSSYSYGGAIYNSSGKISSITGDFVGNYASASSESYGGAISNEGTISSITGDFIGNSASSSYANGGAIYNSYGTISSINGDFIGNSITNTGYGDYAHGGAIYNDGTITLAGNTFTGNYTQVGEGTDAVITPNSIYNAGIINIADGATVTINDGYDGLGEAQLNIGTSASSGSVFNLSVDNGTIQTDNLGTVTNNGTINWDLDVDLTNTNSDKIAASFADVEGNNKSIIINAINLITGTGEDKVEILLTDNSTLKTAYTLSNDILSHITKASSAVTYTVNNVTYDSSTGKLIFNAPVNNFVGNIRNTSGDETITLDSDVDVAADIAEIGDSSTSIGAMGRTPITIAGAGFSVNGNTKGGITVGTGQTLNINNVGAVNGSGEITNNGFTGFGGRLIDNAGTVSISNTNFVSNNIAETTSSQVGGVLRNIGTVSQIIGSNFNNNTVTTSGSASSLWGGIINNGMGEDTYKDAEITLIKDTNFIGNTAHSTISAPHGGVIKNGAQIGTIDNVRFENNTMYSDPNQFGGAHGVAIDNNGNGVITAITNSVFKNNRVYRTGEETTTGNYHASGGAIDNYNRIGEISNTLFEGNSAESVASTAGSGAIMNIYSNDDSAIGRIDAITNVTFKNNHVYSQNNNVYGGAIENGSVDYEKGVGYIGSISGSFEGNYAQSGSSYAYGGAIENTGTIGTISGSFEGNYAQSGSSYAYGGAIYNRRATIGDIIGNFFGNYAQSTSGNVGGGAIENTGTIGTITANFKDNYAEGNYDASGYIGANGGAIVNNGADAKITKIVGDFTTNHAENTGASSSIGGAIVNRNGAEITNGIEGSFTGNYTKVSSGPASGGAIHNNSTIGTITADFKDNYAEGNHNLSAKVGAYGGAILNSGADAKIAKIVGDFTTNHAENKTGISDAHGGAIYNINGAEITNGIEGNFEGNYVKAVSGTVSGGVIYNYSATIGDITSTTGFTGNYVQSSGQVNGGAIHNQGSSTVTSTITSINGNFDGNYAIGGGRVSGGAINNNGYAEITNGITGDFTNNYAKSTGTSALARGGALFNCGDISSVVAKTATGFTGNYTESSGTGAVGGAIAIMTGPLTSAINSISTNFTNNYAYATKSGAYAQGGAIYNAANQILGNVTGDFTNNYAIATGTSGYAQGGAIWNASSANGGITLTDSNFTGNAATTAGGAIYNTGTANIIANGANVTFSNNKTGVTPTIVDGKITGVTGGSVNDIYNTGTVNLKAADGKSITFGGTITDKTTPSGTINIGETSSAYTGIVNFNNTVTQNAINLNSGTMHLGVANAIANVGTFTNNGCTLDTITGALENQNLGNVVLNNNLDMVFEVNLATAGADFFSANSMNAGSYHLVLDTINALANPTVDLGTTDVRINIADANLKGSIQTGDYTINGVNPYTSYKATYATDASYGYLTITDYGNLYTAVHDTSATRTYTLSADEPALADPLTAYGAMEGPATGDNKGTLTINGGGYGVLGGNKGGITVGANQTLNISNVNGSNSTGELENKGFSGFINNTQGAVINNAGTLNIAGTTFTGNRVVINTAETPTESASIYVGGAIHNTGTITNLGTAANKAVFTGNYADVDLTSTEDTSYWREYNGGALLNNGSISTIVADFTNNYIDVSSASTTLAQAYGGAISNRLATSSIGSITGDFSGNYAKSNNDQAYGGAILNFGSIGDINSTNGFVGNYAQSTSGQAYGGAIYNYTATIGDITGNFTGNWAKAANSNASGGAIYNRNASIGDIVATNGFSDNYAKSASNFAYGGAIFNDNGTIGTITADFQDNYAEGNLNESGKMGASGGAIYNNGNITKIVGNFTTNHIENKTGESSAYGGAIMNNGGAEITNGIEGNFTGNWASANTIAYGGAICNLKSAIGDITGNFSDNYTQSSSGYANGGAIMQVGDSTNSTAITSINGNFDGNYTITGSRASGGAIDNNMYSEITNGITGNFTNNYAKSTGTSALARGGAILNFGYIKSITANTTDGFTGNYAQSSGTGAIGGAIVNIYGNASVYGDIDTITSNFTSNYAYATGDSGYAQGGAIYNNGAVEIGNVTGDFTNNYAIATGASGYAQGGAIYNTGTITVTDSNFTGNAATTAGGAIYNTGTTNIIANGANVTFSNNKTGVTPTIVDGKITGVTGGSANDIYNTGTVNLKAADGKSITFGGTITDAATPTGTINIGNTGTETDYTGTIYFGGSVTQNNLTVNDGAKVQIAAGDLNITNAVKNSGAITLTSGTIGTDIIKNTSNGIVNIAAGTEGSVTAKIKLSMLLQVH